MSPEVGLDLDRVNGGSYLYSDGSVGYYLLISDAPTVSVHLGSRIER